jgi:hypothetical protein
MGSRLPGGGVPVPVNVAAGPGSTNEDDADDAFDICRRWERLKGSAAVGIGIELATDSWLVVPESDKAGM